MNNLASKRLLLLAALATVGCSDSEPGFVVDDVSQAPGFRKKIAYLEAPCMVNVEGVGMVDVEEDYIPGVVACENGNAPFEALKAQAVMARAFLYYKLFVAGATTIQNSQADQVYSCTSRLPNGPLDNHRQAAAETRGQYLTFEDSIIASFYVAGAIPPNPDAADPWGSCMGNGGSDATNTQRFVTYNRGRTGCDIEMTNLGLVTADCRDNPHNRGCASQNGQSCLATLGVSYVDMLSYHYGDDVVLEVADGICGANPVSAEDQFCLNAGDGMHCLDADNRIECADGAASLVEACPTGCGESACVEPPDPSVCSDQPDGNLCSNGSALSCVGGVLVASEVCPQGCDGGSCIESGANNANNPPGNNNAAPNNDVGDDDDTEVPRAAATELPPVVGPSPGVDGGCSTASSAGSPVLLMVALLSGIGSRRRRRR